eukprot:CAMPEP_0119504474 /NCGR_PEP_ID=MMETSP1344-20130328/25328_1 /TAXON_ID=236787 /ORGANISM="Florenciella parvula, Strain CCMP2471" /LENGTH=59 /DNA_ID=CAMNT_0007540853 /DNA_START=21 /DNA_END=196 /DNA_ORIENTATION=+
MTPMHHAAASGHEDIVRLLRDRGADPTIKDGPGKTPADYAIEEGAEGALQALQEERAQG